MGYEKYGTIDFARLYAKEAFYKLADGLSICSWAKEVAYEYYLSGVKTLEEVMARFV